MIREFEDSSTMIVPFVPISSDEAWVASAVFMRRDWGEDAGGAEDDSDGCLIFFDRYFVRFS